MNVLIQIFNTLSPNKYIPKKDKIKIEELRKTLIDIKYQELCKELNKLISKDKVSKHTHKQTMTKLNLEYKFKIDELKLNLEHNFKIKELTHMKDIEKLKLTN